jgi:hypothetical protein
MAARTVLTAVQLPNVGGVAQGAGATPDAVNGNIVASPGPFKSLVIAKNADSSSHSLIIRASGYQGVPSGAANSGYLSGQYQPYATASRGDLTVVVVNGTTQVVCFDVDTERFTQADGSLWLDWTASTSMTVSVVQRPYMP